MTTLNDRTKGPAGTIGDRPDAVPDDRRHIRDGDTDSTGDGDPWRGPSEARWIARLLHGAPLPRESAPSPAGLVAHG